MLDQMGASRPEFEERVRRELGFVHGELRNIRAALEDDESDEQLASESVVSSEGERGDLDDPLTQGYGNSGRHSETPLFFNPAEALTRP